MAQAGSSQTERIEETMMDRRCAGATLGGNAGANLHSTSLPAGSRTT
jgi:hypothetical protein